MIGNSYMHKENSLLSYWTIDCISQHKVLLDGIVVWSIILFNQIDELSRSVLLYDTLPIRQ